MKASFTLILMALGLCSTRAVTPLETEVLAAVRNVHFEGVVDFGAGNESRPVKAHLGVPAQRIANPPNVDVAVIQLDEAGNWVDSACVLLSRDYPHGVLAPHDQHRGAYGVRFLRWDIDRFNGGTFSESDGSQLTKKGWTNNPALTGADDLAPGRETAPLRFMAPYPASLFKLMVAFHVMRMVDAGKVSLDGDDTYAVADAKPERRKVREWIDPMITQSDNHATRVLLKLIHDQQEMDALNREFRELNLGTLQINGTDPKNGAGWSPGQIHMTAFDVARLYWLINGGSGELWVGADGKPVTSKYLSSASRAYLKKILSEQGWNEALSTANLSGAAHVRPGIPSRVSERWINTTNGHVVVEGVDCGVDIRAANAKAEVEFAHKTGLTFNYASDAGIVRSLPGMPFRHYIVAIIANLGNRYADEIFADRKTFPAMDAVGPIAYTQRIPALGKAIDEAVTKLSAKGK